MDEYDYCEDIRVQYKVAELNSKTLKYRINGFLKACNMNLENSTCTKDIGDFKIEYINKNNQEEQYNINFYFGSNDKGNNITISGNYNDLNFRFTNYYDGDKNYGKINELPFYISLKNRYQDFKYDMEVATHNKSRTKFIIRKYTDKMLVPYIITFQANVLDFSIILKLVKAFVSNPELVFTSYSDVMDKKNPTLTCGDLNKGIIEDESLDEPVTGVKRIIRSLFK